ncbi:MAG: GNAT family acetyltransferase [Verrucomicrobiae bacterium]|nr:GNAT family acetyltransferase [Verrucomicrobiae bacterium]
MSVKPEPKSGIRVACYDDALHREAVIVMWKNVFGYDNATNEPSCSIDRKMAHHDDLMFVACSEEMTVGTIMAGYDGHRGWLYSLAVLPEYRVKGIGSELVRHAEQALEKLGCVKINLQILESNSDVVGFYESLGYSVEPRISMGKRVV